MEPDVGRCEITTASRGSLLVKQDPIRLTLLDTLSRDGAIAMIVGALRSAHRMCGAHKFGGSSPATLWRLINGVGPKRV